MDALDAAPVHSFFSNEDSNPTYRFYSRSILRIMCIVFILYINLVATHDILPPERYWQSMLPHTAMPKSIAVLLRPAGNGTTVYDEIKSEACAGVDFCYGPPHFETKLRYNPDTALFFLEKDLIAGHKMNLLFHNTSNQASFRPREVVKSIPFSSSKMAEILNKLDVKPGSTKAEVMKNTIEVCEGSGIKGEDKYCATSLESMVDFTILKLGKDVEALSTEVIMKKKETQKQEYTISKGVEKVGETKVVVCHQLNYVYAVFYCHKIDNTVAYTVSLEGADGSKVKAVSVCHRDTSQWNPKHLAFQMLKVKPGASVPICHFLLQDSNISWVPKQN